jgi:hypothetical protein
MPERATINKPKRTKTKTGPRWMADRGEKNPDIPPLYADLVADRRRENQSRYGVASAVEFGSLPLSSIHSNLAG